MTTTARRAAVALAAACLLGAAPAPAGVGPAPGPTGVVVFGRHGGLWAIGAEGGGEPVTVATAANPAPALQSVVVAPTGLVVARAEDGSAWWTQLRLGAIRRLARARGCVGLAIVAPTGDRFACRADGTSMLVQPTTWRAQTAAIEGELGGVTLSGELVVATDDAIYGATIAAPADRRQLAPHRPSGAWLAAPGGQRAAGVYADPAPDPNGGLYQFALDGKAARRRLAADAIPIAWSSDAEWLLLQSPDSACFVRAVGGEYQCWDGFRAVAVSPDDGYVLLARDGDLYTAATGGVAPGRPRLLVRDASHAAAWLARLPGEDGTPGSFTRPRRPHANQCLLEKETLDDLPSLARRPGKEPTGLRPHPTGWTPVGSRSR
jgi:hypothetical protein